MLMRNVFPIQHSNKIDSSPRPSPRSRRRGRRTCAPWFIVLLTLTLLFAGLAAPLTILGAPKIAFPANIDWPAYLGDKERSLYSPLQQINRTNVAQLKVAWTYDTGDKGEYQANNLIVAGVLYTASPTRKVIALDAATARALCKWLPQS